MDPPSLLEVYLDVYVGCQNSKTESLFLSPVQSGETDLWAAAGCLV